MKRAKRGPERSCDEALVENNVWRERTWLSLCTGGARVREVRVYERHVLTGHERPQAAKQRVDAKREVATPFSFSFPFIWVYV